MNGNNAIDDLLRCKSSKSIFRSIDFTNDNEENLKKLKIEFKKVALLVHPDKSSHPKAAEAFMKLYNAYEILSSQLNNCNSSKSECSKSKSETNTSSSGSCQNPNNNPEVKVSKVRNRSFNQFMKEFEEAERYINAQTIIIDLTIMNYFQNIFA